MIRTPMDLTRYDALSFDCYGTLIDWEAGLAAVLGPWARRQAAGSVRRGLLAAYSGHEAEVEAERPICCTPTCCRSPCVAQGRPWARGLG